MAKLKQCATALCAVLLTAALIPSTVRAAGTASITVAQATASPGESVAVAIVLDANPGLAGLRLLVVYDASRLNVGGADAVERGDALADLTFIGLNGDTYNRNPISVAWFGASNDATTGVLLTVTFAVRGDAHSGTAEITALCAPTETFDEDGESVLTASSPGGITVVGGVAEDSSSPTLPSVPSTAVPSAPPFAPPVVPPTFPVTPPSAPIANGPIAFTDVAPSDWFYDAVTFVAERGLYLGVGDGQFAPRDTMTRAMFVTVLARLDGADMTAFTVSPFTDVDISEWYGAAVAWAAELGIIDAGILSDCAPGMFDPNGAVTREQMAVMIANYIAAQRLSLPYRDVAEFADAGDASEWARNAIRDMREYGVINGIGDNRYAPQSSATRAEVAQIFRNLVTVMA